MKHGIYSFIMQVKPQNDVLFCKAVKFIKIGLTKINDLTARLIYVHIVKIKTRTSQ